MPLENQPGAAAPEATPAPGSPAGEQNEQANMAMIGQALKQIGIVLQDIHAAVKGGVNAPAPAAAPGAADTEPMAPQAEGTELDREEEVPGGAKDMELEKPYKEPGGAADSELIGPESGEKTEPPAPEQSGTPSRGEAEKPEVVTGAMDAKSVNRAVEAALKVERARVEALSRAKEDVRYVLGGDLAFDSAADVYRAALVQSGIAESDIPKGGEKAAWHGYNTAMARARGAAPAALVELANDSALKNETQSKLSALTSKIRVQG